MKIYFNVPKYHNNFYVLLLSVRAFCDWKN